MSGNATIVESLAFARGWLTFLREVVWRGDGGCGQDDANQDFEEVEGWRSAGSKDHNERRATEFADARTVVWPQLEHTND